MNCNTGHLRLMLDEAEQKFMEGRGYVPVPTALAGAARKKLAGRPEAFVSLTSGGKLSRFACEQRRKEKANARNRKANKQARQSRAANR